MIDEIKLKFMKHKLTAADFAAPQMSENAKIAMRVVLRRTKKDQDKILKKATTVKR